VEKWNFVKHNTQVAGAIKVAGMFQIEADTKPSLQTRMSQKCHMFNGLWFPIWNLTADCSTTNTDQLG